MRRASSSYLWPLRWGQWRTLAMKGLLGSTCCMPSYLCDLCHGWFGPFVLSCDPDQKARVCWIPLLLSFKQCRRFVPWDLWNFSLCHEEHITSSCCVTILFRHQACYHFHPTTLSHTGKVWHSFPGPLEGGLPLSEPSWGQGPEW